MDDRAPMVELLEVLKKPERQIPNAAKRRFVNLFPSFRRTLMPDTLSNSDAGPSVHDRIATLKEETEVLVQIGPERKRVLRDKLLRGFRPFFHRIRSLQRCPTRGVAS